MYFLLVCCFIYYIIIAKQLHASKVIAMIQIWGKNQGLLEFRAIAVPVIPITSIRVYVLYSIDAVGIWFEAYRI